MLCLSGFELYSSWVPLLNGKKPYNQNVIAVFNYEFILYHSFVAPAIKMNSSVRSPTGSVSLKSVGIP